MVLPNPTSPPTTVPETSAVRTITGRESSAQPSHHDSSEAGAVPGRSMRAGASSGRSTSPAGGSAPVVPARPARSRTPRCQRGTRRRAGSRPGRRRRWLRRWRSRLGRRPEAQRPGSGVGGSTGPGSRGRASARTGATRRPVGEPGGSAPKRRPAGDRGGRGGRVGGGRARRRPGLRSRRPIASNSERPTRVASISTTSLPGPEGSAAAGDQQPVTAALDQLAVAVVGQLGPAAAGMPARGAGRAVGAVVPHQPATPSIIGGDGAG